MQMCIKFFGEKCVPAGEFQANIYLLQKNISYLHPVKLIPSADKNLVYMPGEILDLQRSLKGHFSSKAVTDLYAEMFLLLCRVFG